MKAIIMAGGKGTRLSPYTIVFPKPMLPIGEIPILEIIIRQLAHFGFDDIVISVGHLAAIIQTYFHNFMLKDSNLKISYAREEMPLGTAGPLALLEDLNDTFMVINGDVLTTLDFSDLYHFHKKEGASLTIAVCEKKVRIDLGIVEFGDDHRVTDYIEKPEHTYYDSMGIYVYEPRVLKFIEPGAYLDFPTLVKNLVKNNEKVLSYLSASSYYWIDMGKHQDYEKANEEFAKRKKEFLHTEEDAR